MILLAASADRAADIFCDHFGLRPQLVSGALLEEIGRAFARLPYENLTKLMRKHSEARGAARRRMPALVIREHLELGAGGTCFALTCLFRAVLERMGLKSHAVLCDTRHRAASHCAVVVDVAERPHLVDPGYLVFEPLALPTGSPVTLRGPCELRRVPGVDGVFELYTYGVCRYRLQARPVEQAHFLGVWDASFDWPMMNGVHLTALRSEGGYAYLHGHKLRLRSAEAKQTLNIRGDEARAIEERFGLDPQLVRDAYNLVGRLKGG